MTTVSALVVTYNHSRYIVEAIRSALAQTRPPNEIVVVDDGSTDDTVRSARAVGDARVRVIERPHQGIAALFETYNAGIEACRGDIVALLEGDDRWPADKLARQLPAFEDQEVVLSHGLYAVIGAKGARLHDGVWPSVRVPVGKYRPLGLLLVASFIMSVTVLLRRSAIVAAGGFRQMEGTPHWDYPTFLAIANTGSFVFDPHVDGEWRRHGASAVYRLSGQDLQGIDLSLELAHRARREAIEADLPGHAAIDRGWSEARAHMVWQATRVLLLNGRFREARALVFPALRRAASPALRLRLVLAAAASVCRLNVEGLAGVVAGRSSFKELD